MPIQSLSALLTQNIECLSSVTVHIPKLSLTDEKFESCIKSKCHKPQKQVKIFYRTCLSKTMIIFDIIDFITVIFCSETTHVSRKQRLVVICQFFVLKQEKCYKSIQN